MEWDGPSRLPARGRTRVPGRGTEKHMTGDGMGRERTKAVGGGKGPALGKGACSGVISTSSLSASAILLLKPLQASLFPKSQ